MGRRALPIALVAALMLAAAALALRVLDDAVWGSEVADRPASDLLPPLFAAAGLCTAGLLRHRAPAAAWLATVSVGGLGALEILGSVRSQLPIATPAAGPWLVLVAEAGLIAAAGIAAAYAVRISDVPRTRWSVPWRLIVLGSLAAVTVTTGWTAAEAFMQPDRDLFATPSPGELPPWRISARLAAGFLVVAALAGAWRDFSVPLRRARARSDGIRQLPRAIADEVLPNATAARRHGRDEERARIAADLHALVLPELRRAARAAEDAEARPVASDLRNALEGVERLMHQRQSIVLEEYGLVAALEWLAEQAQQRGGLVVDIELDGADVGNAAAVPPSIGRAAFRVALLALDNVVRHAGASRALIRLDIEGGRGRLAVVDDGRGIEDAAAPLAGRGLIDMRSAANEVRASFAVERGDRGTAVEMAWVAAHHAAEDPASKAADITARGPGAHA